MAPDVAFEPAKKKTRAYVRGVAARSRIDSIARISSVHRTAAARWIARARETLALRVRDRLLAR